MNRYKKILIICPGGAITAGPEALHQLVAALNRLGESSAIVYHPFNKKFSTPLPYENYHVPVEPFQDEENILLVFPEIFTSLALKPISAKTAIWWMSVNNFTCIRYKNPLRDKLRYWKNVIKGRQPWGGVASLKHLQHFTQSHYATQFLSNHGINAIPLSDPIPVYAAPTYLTNLASRLKTANRKNIICYNPKKGSEITTRLMEAFPQWTFRPLHDLNREQLAEAFLSSKIYIDFGHHPGKGRLPREASIHGCCVITNQYGSAANSKDIPIANKFKLNNHASDFLNAFEKITKNIFDHYEESFQQQETYHAIIVQEPDNFDRQIVEAFGLNES